MQGVFWAVTCVLRHHGRRVRRRSCQSGHNGPACIGIQLRVLFIFPFSWSSVMKLKCMIGVLLAGSACSSPPEPATGAIDSSAAANWLALMAGGDAHSDNLPEVSLPGDLQWHPSVPLESASVRAVLQDAAGQQFGYSLQLDRLRLRDREQAAQAVEEAPVSQWSYSDVMRIHEVSGRAARQYPSQRQQLERVAVGLASSSPHRLQVGGSALELTPSVDAGSCHVSWTLRSASDDQDDTVLQAEQQRCPQARSLGLLNGWESAAVPIRGRLAGDEVTGQAWLSHSWGNGLPSAGAVVLDSIRLQLQDAAGQTQELSVTRSKRRSGRGPRTVSGQWLDGDSQASGAQPLSWTDEGEQLSERTGRRYPQSVRLHSADGRVDVRLTPLVPLSEVDGIQGVLWNGAVSVSGTHEGVGFLSLVPVDETGPSPEGRT